MQIKQAGLLASPAPLALLSAKIATRKRLFVSLAANSFHFDSLQRFHDSNF